MCCGDECCVDMDEMDGMLKTCPLDLLVPRHEYYICVHWAWIVENKVVITKYPL